MSSVSYLANTYQISAKMIINDQEKCDHILSEEGSTQGDVTAMAMYAIGTRPLLDILNDRTDPSACQQVWYADDSAAAGKLREIKKWWDILFEIGPKFGYFPNASKTILIVKDSQYDLATELFKDTEIEVTRSGERHLGAVIGSQKFRDEYVGGKVEKWVQDVDELSKTAEDEPQLAYAAYTKAMCMRWCFLQRTIPNTKNYFAPLEDVIRNKFIPAVIGRKVSDVERKILSLPVRLGGMGIQNPILTAEVEFRNSSIITSNLTTMIINQERNLDNYNAAQVSAEIQKLKTEKEEQLVMQLEEVKDLVDSKLKRTIELACEKGAGAWLSALPLQSLGYVLNKQEFRDAICLRYDWKIPHTPFHCRCGQKNSVDHTLNCRLGGYVTMRHNNIRNLEAHLLSDVCKDIKIEPELLPIGNNRTLSTNIADKARLDVSAVGIWSSMERTFLDVRVFHPNSPSYMNTSPEQLYVQHEREKKRVYNDRILQVEKGSFSPLIFSTTGGMGPEATRYHKRIAELISTKRGELYSDVVNHIRTRIRFSLLKSVLVAVRGERGKRGRPNNTAISDISLNLVPQQTSYEV